MSVSLMSSLKDKRLSQTGIIGSTEKDAEIAIASKEFCSTIFICPILNTTTIANIFNV